MEKEGTAAVTAASSNKRVFSKELKEELCKLVASGSKVAAVGEKYEIRPNLIWKWE